MNRATRSSVLGLGVAMLALGACEKSTNNNVAHPSGGLDSDEERAFQSCTHERTPGPSDSDRAAVGGGPVNQPTMADALARIARTRCDHALLCEEIGPSAKYHSRLECVSAVQKDRSSDLNDRACPEGVIESALSTCLDAIRADRCGRSSDALGRITACRAEKFCTQTLPGASPSPGTSSSGG